MNQHPNEALYAQKLIDFIARAVTPYQAVDLMVKKLTDHGYKAYQINQAQALKTGDRYYYHKNGSALIAFEIGQDPIRHAFKIFGAHTDSPGLRVKHKGLNLKDNVIRVNTEVYGGPILNTWFDRPLSLAGRVMVKGPDGSLPQSKLLDFKKPILVLPNLAIHMNRQVNQGVEIKANLHLLPYLAMSGENTLLDNFLQALIAKELACKAEDILDFDLFCYDPTPGQVVGLEGDFIMAPRIDNLGMCQAGLEALLSLDQDRTFKGINVLLYTDNEEVGSRTKQGADGLFMRDVLESIYLNLSASRQDFLASFDHSFMISADQAHAVHPNYDEMADPDHRPIINGGPVIKLAASQSYATDGLASAYFIDLCRKARVPYQWFFNRSDLKGGSTIGSISSARLPMPTVDIGNAIWAMHSCRETAGVKDLVYMDDLLKVFFT